MDNSYIKRLEAAMTEQGAENEAISRAVNYAFNLLNQNLPVFFDDIHVAEVLLLSRLSLHSYHTFPVSQIDKTRIITAPSLNLKQRQKWILSEILNKIPISEHAHGFESGHSIKTNALIHANNDYVFCMDIKDFFPSISRQSVCEIFRTVGYSPKASDMLSKVCCYNNRLPQGAPTSPKLSNIFFAKIDTELANLAKLNNAIYSRYADDLTFSSKHDIPALHKAVEEIIGKYNFTLNHKKTRVFYPGQPKRITGLIVQNGCIRVPKHFKRRLRQEIHYCRQYGVTVHLENTNASHCINYREHLYGKAYFVHMIEPDTGDKLLNMLDEIDWM